jgi:hypothetical protein
LTSRSGAASGRLDSINGGAGIDSLVEGDQLDLPATVSVVSETQVSAAIWVLTLSGDGDGIRLEGITDGGTIGTIPDDVLIV